MPGYSPDTGNDHLVWYVFLLSNCDQPSSHLTQDSLCRWNSRVLNLRQRSACLFHYFKYSEIVSNSEAMWFDIIGYLWVSNQEGCARKLTQSTLTHCRKSDELKTIQNVYLCFKLYYHIKTAYMHNTMKHLLNSTTMVFPTLTQEKWGAQWFLHWTDALLRVHAFNHISQNLLYDYCPVIMDRKCPAIMNRKFQKTNVRITWV